MVLLRGRGPFSAWAAILAKTDEDGRCRAFAVPSIRIREVNPVLSENANHMARPLGEEGAVGAVRSLRQGEKRAYRPFFCGCGAPVCNWARHCGNGVGHLRRRRGKPAGSAIEVRCEFRMLGPSRQLQRLAISVAIGGIADMTGNATGSTRSRMTQSDRPM